VRRVAVLVLLVALGVPASAQARTLTLHQPEAPETTVTVPAGWRAHEARESLRLTRGSQRAVVRVCTLDRTERDMSGRHAAADVARHRLGGNLWGKPGAVTAPAAGGGCVVVTGRGGLRGVARRLRARLGPPGPAPTSDATAERLAREARARTLAQPRASGSATALVNRIRVDSNWEWDLPGGYQHQSQTLTGRGGSERAELVRNASGGFVRLEDQTCWYTTPPAREDDALEPRLELQEWNAPPSRATAWRVSYAPPEPLADGMRLRWSGFVADGEAIVGPDGLLLSVRIQDHGQAAGRSAWRELVVAFAAFPAAIAPVRPQPACTEPP
jgi:hypothetical protein